MNEESALLEPNRTSTSQIDRYYDMIESSCCSTMEEDFTTAFIEGRKPLDIHTIDTKPLVDNLRKLSMTLETQPILMKISKDEIDRVRVLSAIYVGKGGLLEERTYLPDLKSHMKRFMTVSRRTMLNEHDSNVANGRDDYEVLNTMNNDEKTRLHNGMEILLTTAIAIESEIMGEKSTQIINKKLEKARIKQRDNLQKLSSMPNSLIISKVRALLLYQFLNPIKGLIAGMIPAAYPFFIAAILYGSCRLFKPWMFPNRA